MFEHDAFAQQNRTFRGWTCAYLAILYGLILFPILRADRLYNDDLKRALFGRTGWDSTGRPLTTLLMKLLQCYDSALVDISPFTQLGAVAVLAWTGASIAQRYGVRSAWLGALVVFPLGAQPFFLDNLSYKFDALSMTLAMTAALIPFLLIEKRGRSWWWGVLSLFVCLNLYQPAVTAFPVFALLEVPLAQLKEERPETLLRGIWARVTQAAAAGVVYEVVVGIHVNGWVKRKSAPIHGLEGLSQIGVNARAFLHYIGASFNTHWWMYFGPMLVLLAIVPVIVGLRYTWRVRGTQSIWLTSALGITSALLSAVAVMLSFGPLLFLADPPIAGRVLVGLGPLLVAGLIVMEAASHRWGLSNRWTLGAGTLLGAGLCVIASAYGNAASAQKAYEDHVASGLADDIAEASANHALQGLLLEGSVGYAPVTAHVIAQLPIVGSLTPMYIAGSDTFHTHIFLLHYLHPFVDLRLQTDPASEREKASLLARVCEMPPLHTRNSYRLYVIDEIGVVLLGSSYAQRCSSGSHDTGG